MFEREKGKGCSVDTTSAVISAPNNDKSGNITKSLVCLRDQVDLLEKMVAALTNKLSPVLKPSYPKPIEECERKASEEPSEVACFVAEQGIRIMSCRQQLEGIHERFDI